MTMTLAQHNKDVVLGALHAGLAGDVDGFLAAMHPDVVVHEPSYLPYGGTHRGHAGFLDVLTGATELLDLSRMSLVSATADDDRTVMLMTVPLAGTGDIVHITEHWLVVDGRVTDVEVFWFEPPPA